MQLRPFLERTAPGVQVGTLIVAAIGFGIAVYGMADYERRILLIGAGVFAGAVLVYLTLHFLLTRLQLGAGDVVPYDFAPSHPTAAATRSAAPPSPASAAFGSPTANFANLVSESRHDGLVPPSHEPTGSTEPGAAPRAPAMVMVGAHGFSSDSPSTPRRSEVPRVPTAERRRELVKDLPLLRKVLADDAAPPAMPADKTRGRCSGCDTILWAPAARPIRLRCPKCGRTAVLET